MIRTLAEALRTFGVVRTRAWGDVVSVELMRAGKKVFSFQIARRSAHVAEPTMSPWANIRVDTFDELVASKMTALVARGAPRDFRDIYTLCAENLYTRARCWELWQQRQQLAGEDADVQRATLAIRTHLSRIAQARALTQIADAQERAVAEQVRTWFAQEFLHDVA